MILRTQDFEKYQAYLERYKVENSKIAFANLLAYEHFHGAKVYFEEEKMIILSTPSGKTPSIFPPLVPRTDLAGYLYAMKKYFRNEFNSPLFIRDCDEDFVARVNCLGIDYKRIINRGQWEYIYRAEDIRNLSGRKLHKKKNRLNKFIGSHPSYYSRKIQKHDREKVLDFFDYWCRQKGCNRDDNLIFERESIIKLFELMDFLPISGIVTFVDGKIRGFSLGSYLRKDTFVVFVEKADLSKKYEGLYVALRRDTAKIAAPDCTFINLQQDLDIPGIRKSKLSWKPAKILVCDTLKI